MAVRVGADSVQPAEILQNKLTCQYQNNQRPTHVLREFGGPDDDGNVLVFGSDISASSIWIRLVYRFFSQRYKSIQHLNSAHCNESFT